MRIAASCINCKKDIVIKSNSKTRPDIQMEKGDQFEVRCSHCGNRQDIHVNDIKAEVNNNTILIGAGIGVLITLFLWNLYGAIGTVSMIVPLLIWKQQMDAVKTFNSFMIRRK